MYWTQMAELFGRDTSSRSKSSGVSGGLFVSIKICSVCKVYVYAANMLHSPLGEGGGGGGGGGGGKREAKYDFVTEYKEASSAIFVALF